MYNRKSHILVLWNRLIFLCHDFVESTNIISKDKNNEHLFYTHNENKSFNITPLITSIINEAVSVFESNCLQVVTNYHNYNLVSYITNNTTIQRCIHNMIIFFSSCYEDKKVYISDLDNVFGGVDCDTIEYMISIWCVCMQLKNCFLYMRVILLYMNMKILKIFKT